MSSNDSDDDNNNDPLEKFASSLENVTVGLFQHNDSAHSRAVAAIHSLENTYRERHGLQPKRLPIAGKAGSAVVGRRGRGGSTALHPKNTNNTKSPKKNANKSPNKKGRPKKVPPKKVPPPPPPPVVPVQPDMVMMLLSKIDASNVYAIGGSIEGKFEFTSVNHWIADMKDMHPLHDVYFVPYRNEHCPTEHDLIKNGNEKDGIPVPYLHVILVPMASKPPRRFVRPDHSEGNEGCTMEMTAAISTLPVYWRQLDGAFEDESLVFALEKKRTARGTKAARDTQNPFLECSYIHCEKPDWNKTLNLANGVEWEGYLGAKCKFSLTDFPPGDEEWELLKEKLNKQGEEASLVDLLKGTQQNMLKKLLPIFLKAYVKENKEYIQDDNPGTEWDDIEYKIESTLRLVLIDHQKTLKAMEKDWAESVSYYHHFKVYPDNKVITDWRKKHGISAHDDGQISKWANVEKVYPVVEYDVRKVGTDDVQPEGDPLEREEFLERAEQFENNGE